jgi:hypothetical protein
MKEGCLNTEAGASPKNCEAKPFVAGIDRFSSGLNAYCARLVHSLHLPLLVGDVIKRLNATALYNPKVLKTLFQAIFGRLILAVHAHCSCRFSFKYALFRLASRLHRAYLKLNLAIVPRPRYRLGAQNAVAVAWSVVELRAISFLTPPLQEQTRITTILSDMDAEIGLLETKLEKYRQVKLGMMQNLLTGKIRLV